MGLVNGKSVEDVDGAHGRSDGDSLLDADIGGDGQLGSDVARVGFEQDCMYQNIVAKLEGTDRVVTFLLGLLSLQSLNLNNSQV